MQVAPKKIANNDNCLHGPARTAPQSGPIAQTPPPSQEPIPTDKVQVSVYNQDPWVGAPVTQEIDRSKIGDSLSGPRVSITDWGHEKPKPDANGNYLLAPGTDGLTQVNAHVTTVNTLELMEKYRGGAINWAFNSPTLEVVPHKQVGKNAYYSRWEQSTNFLYFNSQQLGTTVKTANSADIVSHETGHAILDGIRPGYFGTSDPETGAFHEGFGDCVAMLVNVQQEANRVRIMEQTGGNLRTNNNLSALAEEFGKATKLANTDPADDDRFWLRNGNNSFVYKPASELPAGKGDEFTLGREVHSFSRVWSGAFYDVLEGIYKEGIFGKQPPADALKYAADTAGPLLIRAIETGPTNRVKFKDIALGMIKADEEKNGGKYGQILKDAFLKRQILKPEDLAQQPPAPPPVTLDKPLENAQQAVELATNVGHQLGLPATANLEPVGLYTNADGEQFVTMQYAQEVPVTVPGLNGKLIDVYGGVTMVFDKNGKLSDYHHSPIDGDAVATEMKAVADMKAHGTIMASNQQQGNAPWMSNDGRNMYKAVVRGNKLVRVPVSNCSGLTACCCGGC